MFKPHASSMLLALLVVALAFTTACAPAQNSLQQSVSDTDPAEAPVETFPTTAPSTAIGAIEFATPSVSPAVFHATLPVPPNTFMGNEAFTPLVLVDANSNRIETQLEIVARHPAPGAGASVVEIIGRMDIPANAGPTIKLFVEHAETPRAAVPQEPSLAQFIQAPADLPSATAALLSNPSQIQIAAEDVFGNIYILDLLHDPEYDQGARRTERFGPLRTEFRHHGWMRPINPDSGSQGTLPHLFGVHAYVRLTAGDPVIELDLRIHNGADGRTADNQALPEIYFRKLSLLLPHGWAATHDIEGPGIGTPVNYGGFQAFPLVSDLDDGKLHFMPQLGQMHRRIILAPDNAPARAASHRNQEGLGFARPGPGPIQDPQFWSWWNTKTAFYFPQAHIIPRLDQISKTSLDERVNGDYEYLTNHYTQGTGGDSYPVASNGLGWAHPYGVAYGGMTGGDGIDFHYGIRTLIACSANGYRRLQLLHRMDTERMPNAFYGVDGNPTTVNDWLVPNEDTSYLPFYFYMAPSGSNDPFGLTTAPQFQTDYVKANRLDPDYETTLRGYKAIDLQHLVRYTGPAKALAWIGNDSLAKDDIELQAELFHLTYHMFENSKYHHIQGTTMLADRNFVDENPGQGFAFGRGEGWGLDTMTAAYQLGGLDFRARKFPWFKSVTKLLFDGQSACTGIIQSAVYGKMLGGKFRVSQIIEASIVQNALFGAVHSVMHQKDAYYSYLMADVLRKSLEALLRPEVWDPGRPAPYSQLAVAPLDLNLSPYCGTTPDEGHSTTLDGYQQWASLAYGLEATVNPAYITYAEKMLGTPLTNLLSDQKLSNLGNRAALIAVTEYLWPNQ